MAKQVVQQIARTFGFSATALYVRKGGEIHRAGFDDTADIEHQNAGGDSSVPIIRDEKSKLIITPIRLGGKPIGSLAVSGGLCRMPPFNPC